MADTTIIHDTRPGEKVSLSTGQSLELILRIPKLSFLIDGHSHIQSGACCPLPLIWAKNIIARKLHIGRSFLNFIGSIFLGSGGRIQKKTTEQIAFKLVEEIQRTYGPESRLRTKKDEEFFPVSFIMLMDMDYAHIAGFPPTGAMIYHAFSDKVIYYERKEAFAPEDKGKTVNLSRERPNMVWVYQAYYRQHFSTIEAVKRNPWQLIPMFHFDPRRWRNPSEGEWDNENWYFGPWDYPFEYIATLGNAGIFIGFKMYPPLGYKPLDFRLQHLEEFYARCEAENIPILTHCSPGGVVTHEDEFYCRLDRVDLQSLKKNNAGRIIGYDPTTPEGYFQDEYVHPKNWRKVLEKYPDLKLCLAHFGGDEWTEVGIESDWIQEIVKLTKEFPNVYTDMSCYDLEDKAMKNNIQVLLKAVHKDPDYRHLQDKLIFGVDWYLSLITGAPEYKEYVESFYTTMKEIDEEQWQRSAMVNPAMFYGLDNPEILCKMNVALKNENADKTKRENGLKKLMKVKDQIALMNSTGNET